MRATGEESPRCLTDKEKFLAWRDGDNFKEQRGYIEARDYVAECLTEEAQYIMCWSQYDSNPKEQVWIRRKWRLRKKRKSMKTGRGRRA